MSRVS